MISIPYIGPVERGEDYYDIKSIENKRGAGGSFRGFISGGAVVYRVVMEI